MHLLKVYCILSTVLHFGTIKISKSLAWTMRAHRWESNSKAHREGNLKSASQNAKWRDRNKWTVPPHICGEGIKEIFIEDAMPWDKF